MVLLLPIRWEATRQTVIVKLLMVVLVVGVVAVLLPSECIRFRIVGVSFIIILPMMPLAMQKITLKAIVPPIKRHWQTALKQEAVKIHCIEMERVVVR
ncbi:hypothetical protein NEISICOT_00545 [Neisseria sicca ATCC 29256]|uniref:Uncharacterized protein n=1 Tax=Neisseria sicca ATCC 29256 TaxID=547045 RepID=C6M208_NEISI|nr:hypothetical protein NEISICOT_00545 [Neisseria sicca ATCC 29256]